VKILEFQFCVEFVKVEFSIHVFLETRKIF